MYRTIKNQRQAECIRWHAYNGKRLILPPSNPQRILQIRHLIRHYTACLAVVDMLDAKDPYTAEHSLRVSKMCLRLALMLRLPRVKIVNVTIAAGVHDIGKVGARTVFC